ncbi:MAG: histidine phosphatase family protein [Coriobacteriia bacterium]|nr:histidine phosphatase family protein [Coriobacteriia bacterium]
MTCEILLVRHPETTANVEGRLVGRGSAPFTRTGRAQLRRVPRKVVHFKPDVVWSSPLERALVLANAAGRACGHEVHVDSRLMELDFGQAEGMTFEEVAAAGMAFNYRDRERPVAPGGESRADIERRSSEFCRELIAQGGRHAVVTHGGVFRAALVALLGLASTDIWAFHIHNAQLATVRVVDGHGTLERYVEG